MKREVDVLIIGGGSIGICSAHFLTQQGRKVVVVDKGEICSGSSYGNVGLVVPSHCVPLAAPGVIFQSLKWMFNPESPFYLKPRFDPEFYSWLWKFRAHCTGRHRKRAMPVIRDLSLASIQLFEELAGLEGVEFGFEERGKLILCRTEKGLKSAIEEARLQQEIGLESEILDPAQIREREPDVRIEAKGAVFYPRDAHLDPARFVRELAGYVEQQGGEMRPSTEVMGFEKAEGRITAVETTRGTFAPAEVVLAGGSWSPQIVRELQLELPIQPAKGYSITFKRPSPSPSVPLMLAEAKVGINPMGDALRFGGTLELAGFDLSITRRRVKAILEAVPHYLPDLDPAKLELIEVWRGLRPCTPDGLPLVGRARAWENLTVAAGHAMIGISLGPITGKLVGQVVVGEEPEIDLSPLAVERFNEPDDQ